MAASTAGQQLFRLFRPNNIILRGETTDGWGVVGETGGAPRAVNWENEEHAATVRIQP